MLAYLITSIILAVLPLFLRSERATNIVAALFFVVQAASIAALFYFERFDSVLLEVFRADTLAVVFHILMTCVLGFTLIHSSQYL